MDPCRPPERLWCCASADTQDLVGIYGVSTGTFFFLSFVLLVLYHLPPILPVSPMIYVTNTYTVTQRRFENSTHLFPWDFFFLFTKEMLG